MPQTTPRSDNGTSDVTNIVKDMLDEMESEFTLTGNNILQRLNEMNKRMDDLDTSISELMTDAGLEKEQQSSAVSAASTNSQGRENTSSTSPNQKEAAVL